MDKVDHKQARPFLTPWNIALLVALAAALWLIWEYVALVAVCFLAAYVFRPLYRKYRKLFRGHKVGAAVATVISSLVIVLIPIILLGILIALQTADLIATVQRTFSTTNLDAHSLIQQSVDSLNRLLAHFTGNAQTFSYDQAVEWVSNILVAFGTWLLDLLRQTIQSVPRFITNLFLYTFITGSILAYQEKFVQAVENINPMGSSVSRLYINKMTAMTKAMLMGQFVTAVIQGAESAAVFALLGYENYFFIMLPLFTFMSIIPLGAGIITIPLGLLMIATGQVVPGVIVIANHILVVSTIDNFTRPKFVSRDAYLPTALTLLATFAGLARFGFLGIIYGPIIMILVVTTIQVYLEVNGLPTIFPPKPNRPKRKLFRRTA